MMDVSRSAAARSMRDSSDPRGMCTAPGIRPSSHSSRSRTSTTSGGSPLERGRPAGRRYRRAPMTPRARVSLIVAAAALAAAGITVVATVLTATDETDQAAPPAVRPRPGAPPLVLDLGVRTDPEARALRRAAALYERRRRV